MRGGDGRGGSKKYKSIPALPCGAGLKSCPIPTPSPLRGGENPHGAKRGGAGQAGRGKIVIPNNSNIVIVYMYIYCAFFKKIIIIIITLQRPMI